MIDFITNNWQPLALYLAILLVPCLPFLLFALYQIITDRAYSKGYDAAWSMAAVAQQYGKKIVA